MEQEMDVVAIGALNLDYRVQIGDNPKLWNDVIEACPRVRWGSEVGVEIDEFSLLKDLLRDRVPDPRLGGSAFNALRVARRIGPDLCLAMMGAIGNSPSGSGFERWFKENGVGTQFVIRSDSVASGSCLSLEAGDERTLITTRGANDRICELLKCHGEAIGKWAAQAKIIHLSSFLDADSPGLLADMIGWCRDHNPRLQISIDPGAEWAARYHHCSSIRRLLDMASLLFLNQEEFNVIFGSRDGSSAEPSARGGLACATILLKQSDRLTVFGSTGQLLQERRHVRLLPEEVVDSTGAGDVLAGAYVAASLKRGSFDEACLVAAQAVVELSLRRGRNAEMDFKHCFLRALNAWS